MYKVCIILLNWNGKKDTLECLASLVPLKCQVLVVDNGSLDDSVATFRSKFPHVPVLETRANLGFAGGNNVGIEWALRHRAEWILLLNNDTIVDPNLLHAFLDAAQKRPQAKIFGAKILRYHTPNIIDHLGGYWDATKAEFFSHHSGKEDTLIPMQSVDYVCGAALFMHRSVPEKIGLLEEKYFLFWEESDFCIRAKKAGFEVWTAPDAKIWHKVSSSFTGGKPHTHYFWWRSRLLFLSRHHQNYHKIILPEIWKMVRHYLIRTLLFRKKTKADFAGPIPLQGSLR